MKGIRKAKGVPSIAKLVEPQLLALFGFDEKPEISARSNSLFSMPIRE
jgi:hypothetical protein